MGVEVTQPYGLEVCFLVIPAWNSVIMRDDPGSGFDMNILELEKV